MSNQAYMSDDCKVMSFQDIKNALKENNDSLNVGSVDSSFDFASLIAKIPLVRIKSIFYQFSNVGKFENVVLGVELYPSGLIFIKSNFYVSSSDALYRFAKNVLHPIYAKKAMKLFEHRPDMFSSFDYTLGPGLGRDADEVREIIVGVIHTLLLSDESNFVEDISDYAIETAVSLTVES